MLFKRQLSSQIRDESYRKLPRYHPGSRAAAGALFEYGPVVGLILPSGITEDDSGLLNLAISYFSLRLRKDFLLIVLPWLTPLPGSLSKLAQHTRFHHRFL